MSGKVNIVFGFFISRITAFLGPFTLCRPRGVDYQKFVEMNKAVEAIKQDVSLGKAKDPANVEAALRTALPVT